MANERRLIDANDFLAELKERHENIMQDPEVSKHMKWCEAVHYGATTAIIEKMPTIEATPVVHGRWEAVHDGWGRCPNCHRMDSIHEKATHCRFCGTKMDGGVSDG